MFVHDASIEFPQLKQVNLPSGRVYRVEGGEHAGNVYPSITRILHANEKPGIAAWRARVGETEARRIRDRASARGQKLHTLAERFLQNEDIASVEPYVLELWQYLRPWLTTHITTIYQQETNVFSNLLGVAGRFDLLADVDGQLSVVDFKQADKPKRDAWIEDYYLQGTFYSLAVYEMTGRKVKRIVFPITNPAGLQVFETRPLVHFTQLRERIAAFYKDLEAADLLTLENVQTT